MIDRQGYVRDWWNGSNTVNYIVTLIDQLTLTMTVNAHGINTADDTATMIYRQSHVLMTNVNGTKTADNTAIMIDRLTLAPMGADGVDTVKHTVTTIDLRRSKTSATVYGIDMALYTANTTCRRGSVAPVYT